MGDVVKKKRLRMITYMSPSIPVEVFETIRDYVEKITGLQASLIYESRWSGPPAERDPDPLKNDDVDIAFMCTTGFRRLLNENNKFAELCKAAPVYIHPNNNANQPIFFSDIIIHADSSTKYENFVDLKGCRWAYSDHVSLSGNLMALSELRRRGYDSNFFGTVIQSGSSLKSIDMLLEKKVDAASVDSTCLQNCFRKDPSLREKIKIFKSLGPLPVQPIIFNSRLPDDTKKLITEGLLAMDKDISWNKKLKENNILRFHPIDLSFYDLEANLQEIVKGLSINTAYY